MEYFKAFYILMALYLAELTKSILGALAFELEVYHLQKPTRKYIEAAKPRKTKVCRFNIAYCFAAFASESILLTAILRFFFTSLI